VGGGGGCFGDRSELDGRGSTCGDSVGGLVTSSSTFRGITTCPN
jgi:hypothetical protein